MSIISIIFKGFRKIKQIIFSFFYTPIAWIYLILNGAIVGSGLNVKGFLKERKYFTKGI